MRQLSAHEALFCNKCKDLFCKDVYFCLLLCIMFCHNNIYRWEWCLLNWCLNTTVLFTREKIQKNDSLSIYCFHFWCLQVVINSLYFADCTTWAKFFTDTGCQFSCSSCLHAVTWNIFNLNNIMAHFFLPVTWLSARVVSITHCALEGHCDTKAVPSVFISRCVSCDELNPFYKSILSKCIFVTVAVKMWFIKQGFIKGCKIIGSK